MTATAALTALPNGSNVFIDANIFIYGLANQSSECREFLARCSREELFGFSLYDVVADATHRFMLAEALSKGIISKASASAMKAKAHSIAGLTDYWVNTRRILDLNLVFAGLDDTITRAAQGERASAGLLTKDSLIVAFMRRTGLRYLATSDKDFSRVDNILVHGPTDLPRPL